MNGEPEAAALNGLPEQHRKIAEVIGVDATIKLCETYGGMNLYIPMMDAVRTAERDRAIREEYNGANVARLARKHSLSVRAVYAIVQGTNVVIAGQISLWDGSAKQTP